MKYKKSYTLQICSAQQRRGLRQLKYVTFFDSRLYNKSKKVVSLHLLPTTNPISKYETIQNNYYHSNSSQHKVPQRGPFRTSTQLYIRQRNDRMRWVNYSHQLISPNHHSCTIHLPHRKQVLPTPKPNPSIRR